MTPELPAPRPIWGRVSIGFAGLAVVSPIVVAVVMMVFMSNEAARPAETPNEANNRAWAWLGAIILGLAAAAAAAGVSAIGGAVTGLVAVLRGERPAWPGWFGLAICTIILVVLGGAYLNSQQ